VSGATSRLRVKITTNPTALYHMVYSSRRPYVYLVSFEA
jgi:hypothetical protein